MTAAYPSLRPMDDPPNSRPVVPTGTGGAEILWATTYGEGSFRTTSLPVSCLGQSESHTPQPPSPLVGEGARAKRGRVRGGAKALKSSYRIPSHERVNQN